LVLGDPARWTAALTTNRVLYLLGSAAPPVLNVSTVIEQAYAHRRPMA
jgi:hypothetical protein